MLEVATGIEPFQLQHDADERPFHLVVRAPDRARTQAELVERIVRRERPAHVTYRIEYGDFAEENP